MSKDPAFLFYYQDWLVGTYFLKRREKGAYMDLLCYQADKGILTLDVIKEVLNGDFDCWDKIRDKFIEEDGFYYNKRLRQETEKRKKFTESRRKNLSHMGVHMENENENRNKDDIEERKKVFFEKLNEYLEKYGPDMLQKFFNYWSEPDKTNRKMRWEMEKTWHLPGRLSTWKINDERFKK